MFQQKLNKDTILHYGSMLLGAAVLSFGLFNVHSQSKITEGGILGLTLFLHHWTGISPGIFSFLLDMTCYIIGFKLLGTDFLVFQLADAMDSEHFSFRLRQKDTHGFQ